MRKTGVLAPLDMVTTFFCKINSYIGAFLLFAMTFVICMQVILRPFNISFSWSEDLTIYMMIWLAFLFFPYTHKYRLNSSIMFVVETFASGRWAIFIKIILELIILFVLMLFFFKSIPFVRGGLHAISLSMGIPKIYFYVSLPYSFGLTALVSLESLLEYIISFVKNKPHLYDSPSSALEKGDK